MPKPVDRGVTQTLTRGFQSFSVIFTTVAAVITFLYYVNSELDKKIVRTMDLRKEYATGVRQSYLQLLAKWNVHAVENGGVIDRDHETIERIVIAFFKNQENEIALLDVLDFFDMLRVCVQNRVCDRNTALTMFDRPGTYTFEMFAFYIFEIRKSFRDPKFGVGLEYFYRLQPESSVRRFL